MFWGLPLEPSKKYTQRVERAFHISQATLDLKSADLEPIQVILEFDGTNFILAHLSKKLNIFQVPLDLNFDVGEQISFRTIGKGRVFLTGYTIMEPEDELGLLQGDISEDSEVEEEDSVLTDGQTPGKRKKALTKSNEKKKKKMDTSNEFEDEDEESDSDGSEGRMMKDAMDEDTLFDDDDDDDEDEEDSVDEESGDEDGEEDEDEEEDESEEEPAPTPKSDKKKKENQNQILSSSVNGVSKRDKKNKFKTEGTTPKKEIETPKKEGLSPKKEKQGKTPKQESAQKKTPKNEIAQRQDTKTPNTSASPKTKRVLEGNVIIEELQIGDGPIAKPGKMVQVYYSGRLKSNNKLFDSSLNGPGFKFRLGKGEVIKGWDIGVNGMKVGGKRKLIIPSAMAYGARGYPPTIPPSSTLVFEVELRGVN